MIEDCKHCMIVEEACALRGPSLPITFQICTVFSWNKDYDPSHVIIDLLCESDVIWIKSDGAFLIINKYTNTYIQH